jgi:hypothetical protein
MTSKGFSEVDSFRDSLHNRNIGLNIKAPLLCYVGLLSAQTSLSRAIDIVINKICSVELVAFAVGVPAQIVSSLLLFSQKSVFVQKMTY